LRTSDAWVAAGVAGVSALVFLSTFSSRVALGDAPESVSGIKTLGVLHAPGYPTYVLAARVFADIVPVGGWALRVNLFSVVCSALLVGAIYLLGRSFGASVAGAGIAALALATTTSFWFNADFAKHYAYSGLLVATGALLAVVWQQRQHARYLVLAGIALGAGIGSSWELALLMTAGVVVLLALGPRRPPLVHAVLAAIGLLVVAGAGFAFMIWRARQHPAVNWGEVTSTGRLIEQITQRDFQGQGAAQSGIAGVLGRVPGRFVTYIGIIVRDVGLGAIAAAVIGAGVATMRLGRDRKLFLVVVGLGNLVAVVFVAGIDHIQGFFTGLFGGGYLIDVLLVLTVLAALGITWLLETVDDWASNRPQPSRSSPRRRIDPRRLHVIAVAGIAVAIVAPSLVVHYAHATHRMPPLADDYGRRVLAALPQNSVLVVGGYEFSEPMSYRQIVDGDRPDVTIVSADLLSLTWYREQLGRRMALGAQFERVAQGTNTDETVRLVKLLRPSRPVYLDTISMAFLGNAVGYEADGLVGRVVAGTGPHVNSSLDADADALHRADSDDGLSGDRWRRFPNQFVYYFHQRAHIELAKQFLLRADPAAVESQLEAALTLVPKDGPSNVALALLRRHDPSADSYIRSL